MTEKTVEELGEEIKALWKELGRTMGSPFSKPQTVEDWQSVANGQAFLADELRKELDRELGLRRALRRAVFRVLSKIMAKLA